MRFGKDNIEKKLTEKYQGVGVDILKTDQRMRYCSLTSAPKAVKKAAVYAICGSGILFGGYFIKGCAGTMADAQIPISPQTTVSRYTATDSTVTDNTAIDSTATTVDSQYKSIDRFVAHD